MSAPIKLQNLVKNYGQVQAVRDVSFEMQEGEVFGLLGPNGAGKTTIISILTCIEKATSGLASIFGEDVSKEKAITKIQVGVVPQELLSHGFFSIEEVLNFYSGYYGIRNNKDHIHYLLDRMGLLPHKDKKVRELSGGLKRRFLIAKALVHKPKLLLLDEPTAGVDIELRNRLWDFVRELNQTGVSVLLTTHYLEEAEMLCNRVGIIHLGEIKQIGETKSLIKDLTNRRVELTLKEPVTTQSKYVIENNPNSVICSIPSQMAFGDLLGQLKIDSCNILDIKIKEGTLEEAFMSIVGPRNDLEMPS